MNKQISCALAIAAAASPGLALAQDRTSADEQVIVTASRAPGGVGRSLLGASVTQIGAVDLALRQVRVISDVLRDVPGVSVSRAGGVGAQTQVRMRGSEANHTLVLIDGMEVSDPYQGEFDFAALIADEVARIEVLRGQQGALYGSDAIGGVVHYITASGAEAPGVRGRGEYGSFNSVDGAVRIAGADGAIDYALSAGYQSSDGTPNARFGARELGASNTVVSGRIVYALSDRARVRAIGRITRSEADVNDQDFSWPPGPTYGFVIDSDDRSEAEAAYGLVSGEVELLEGRWAHALTVQGASAEREAISGSAREASSEGGRTKAAYVTSLRFGTPGVAQTLTGAVDFERERFQTTSPGTPADFAREREIENIGYVAQYDLIAHQRFGLGAAYRFDSNDRFADSEAYRLQASYRTEIGARLHAASGSGVKNPGYSELYGFAGATYVGNPELKAERSTGWEVGLEQRFAGGGAYVDITYFSSTLEDEIALNCALFPLCTPVNLAIDSEQQGIEVSGEALLGARWRIHGAYTYLDAEQNGVEEVRRPPHIASLNVSWRALGDAFGGYVSVRYNGETFDSNFTLSGDFPTLLPAYTLVNIGGDVRLSERVSLYGRVENALDEEYEEIYTYRSPGRGAFVGLRAYF